MPRISLLPLLACLAVACGSSAPSTPRDCPEYQQAGCPTGALGYDTGIGDVLTERCSPCHAEGGIEATRLLTDYGHASGQRMSIATQLVTCSMPPFGAPPLSNDERKQILDWLTCGAPR
jgi:cytochrome c5